MICLVRTFYCSPLATLLFLYLVVFRRRAHGPCSKRIYTCPCTLPSPISTSCLYGLGKPYFVLLTCTNGTLSLRASLLRVRPCVHAVCSAAANVVLALAACCLPLPRRAPSLQQHLSTTIWVFTSRGFECNLRRHYTRARALCFPYYCVYAQVF